ncbi:MAG: hypothetical protein U9N59_11395, partial [Campylobacterota bacterium]|nr:hypothetical protein [Campylobacterota bacterium]
VRRENIRKISELSEKSRERTRAVRIRVQEDTRATRSNLSTKSGGLGDKIRDRIINVGDRFREAFIRVKDIFTKKTEPIAVKIETTKKVAATISERALDRAKELQEIEKNTITLEKYIEKRDEHLEKVGYIIDRSEHLDSICENYKSGERYENEVMKIHIKSFESEAEYHNIIKKRQTEDQSQEQTLSR